MNRKQLTQGLLGLLASLALAAGAAAQTVNSGSTGSDGPFNPPTQVPPGTTVSGTTYTVPLPPSGIYHFTTITIPSGTTVQFTRNAPNTPVTLLATGDVLIQGTLRLDGGAGSAALIGSTATFLTGGLGGPGGADGGAGADGVTAPVGGTGLGPGGGSAGSTAFTPCGGAGGGFGTAGGDPNYDTRCGTSGSPYGTAALLPLLGGSGGGGGRTAFGNTGGGGGGGGGALLLATNGTLTLTGTLAARGGSGGSTSSDTAGAGGGGSGGALRVVATTLAGSGGSLLVSGGAGGGTPGGSSVTPGGGGGQGRIRVETSTSTAAWSFSTPPGLGAPGAVTASASPSLRIVSVAGVPAPAAPQGRYGNPDLTLPAGTTNPVAVSLGASNIPVGTPVQVTVLPRTGATAKVTSPGLSGPLENTTATVNVTLPLDQPAILAASATFALVASLGTGPIYAENEEVTHVRVEATLGGPSTLTYLTASGKEVPAGQIAFRW